MIEKKKNNKLREKIIEVIMFCTRKDHYGNVEDFDWLIFDVYFQIILHVKTIKNA